MANVTQSDGGTDVGVVSSEELETLQTILAIQGKPVSYEEAADISYQLLGFFEALGEDNGQGRESHA